MWDVASSAVCGGYAREQNLSANCVGLEKARQEMRKHVGGEDVLDVSQEDGDCRVWCDKWPPKMQNGCSRGGDPHIDECWRGLLANAWAQDHKARNQETSGRLLN